MSKFPIDFDKLPLQADIDPWTVVKVSQKRWDTYKSSLDVSKFSVEDMLGDVVRFRVSDRLAFDIEKKLAAKTNRYYLSLKQTIIYSEDQTDFRIFAYHMIHVGKSKSKITMQYQTVIPLLALAGLSMLLNQPTKPLYSTYKPV